MILSRKFVKDYIDLDDNLSIKQIAEDMTSVGNEYDSARSLIECTNLVVGEVLECENHPNSDHLHVCKVDVGNEVLDIVCGAPNVRKGLKVVVALVGAKLPGGEIKSGKIRGCISNGMLCSKEELGIDKKFLSEEDYNGICELDSNTKLGMNAIEALGLDDEIIDFELTSNRGDELSILGLAYELGAIYDKKTKEIDLSYNESNEKIEEEFSIDIKTNNCSLFITKKVKNIKICESPNFIKSRLIACGIRPINNVVDISNYVMLETGQPLHFYDADSIGNKLIVRMANDGEELITLDSVKRILCKDDIVISKENEIIGLAGIMGGLSTEVENNTKNIIIESAIFDPILVRKTSKKVLRSEASIRFEKGLDYKRTYMAINRACSLLEKYADGNVLSGEVIYDKTVVMEKQIDITVKNINDVLGTNVDSDMVINVFNRLGFITSIKNDILTVDVPTRRLDINIKEDLIEEFGRIYGINKIVGKLPKLNIKPGKYDKTTRDIRNKLVDLGLYEVLTQIFINENLVHEFSKDEFSTVKLLDPLSTEKNALRYSILSSLIKVYNYNISHDVKDIRIFEMGKGFYLNEKGYNEDYKLGILMSGEYFKQLGKDIKVDFYVIKGIVEDLLDFLGYSNRYSFIKDNNIPNELHPGVSASINLNGKNIGIIGKLHPTYVKKDVYVVEINLDKLFENKTGKIQYKEVSKYPSISKDMAFVVDKNIESSLIENTIKKSAGKLLVNLEVFDIYTGENIGVDKKSIAYNLTFNDQTKTLSDDEVMIIFNKIINEVRVKFNAVLRDK